MYQHVDPLCPDLEQDGGLDQLQRLVHQRCAVDGDLEAHAPLGMRRCLGRRCPSHVLQGRRPEGTARRRQSQFVERPSIPDALEDRAMLRIHRQDRNAGLGRGIDEDAAGADDALLVGEGQMVSRLHRRHRRFKSCGANNSRQKPVTGPRRSLHHGRFTCSRCNPATLEARTQFRQFGLVRDHRDLRTDIQRLLGKGLCVLAGRDGHDLKPGLIPVRMPDHFDGGFANGTGRTENGDAPNTCHGSKT